MNCLPLLVIGIIVGTIIVISLNEAQINVVALPTGPSIEAERMVTPTTTVTPALPTATPTELTGSPDLTPTVLHPNGRRFVLRYDDNTLFVRNTTENRVKVESFAFERLDTAGNPLNRVEGTRWARLYPYINAMACIKIMFWDRISVLSPPSCQGINSEAREKSDTALDFWTPQEGSTHFRVLWKDQEVARCEISAGRCVVYVP